MADVKKKPVKKDRGPILLAHGDAIRTGQGVTPDGLTVINSKLQAALNLWSMLLGGGEDMMFKANLPPLLQQLLERGDVEERHAAMGCVSLLALSEKHIAEVVNNRVIAAAVSIMSSDHARGKLPAVQLLRHLAARAEWSSKVADAALPALVELLKTDGLPGWGQMRQAQTHAAHTLKLLLENYDGEPAELRQLRRILAVQLGAVAPLVAMVAYSPRMPPPAAVPAPPPVMGGKGKKKAGATKKVKPETALGVKDAAATVAASVLRFLSLVPEFVEEIMRTGALPHVIEALLTCGAEQAAYLCGILWEVTAEQPVAAAAAAAGGVPALLHVISRNLLGCKTGKAKAASAAKPGDKKDGKAGAGAAGKKDGKDGKGKGGAAPEAPVLNFPDVAVCNAAGALQHLTFGDEQKQEVVLNGGVPILTACLKVTNPQTYENASGALWNVGLDVRNGLVLAAAGAPGFLAQPVPPGWLTRGPSAPSGDQGAAGEGQGEGPDVRDAVFLTQQLQI